MQYAALFIGLIVFICTAALGQEAPPVAPEDPASVGALLYGFVIAAVPVLIRFLKQYAEQVPAHWLPTIGPLVGALGAIALHYGTTGVPGVNGLSAAGIGFCLGAIGTGLREVVAQWTKRITDGVQPAKLK